MGRTFFKHNDFPESSHELVAKIFDGEIEIYPYESDIDPPNPLNIPRTHIEHEKAETRCFRDCPVDQANNPNKKVTKAIFNRWATAYADVWVPGGNPTLSNFKPCLEAVLLYHYDLSSNDEASYKSAVSAVSDKNINHEVRRHLLLKILPKLRLRRVTATKKPSEPRHDTKSETPERKDSPGSRVNERLALALEFAKQVKKNHPELTRKDAAKQINLWLAEEYKAKSNIARGYSEKYLMRLIKKEFKPGKPGNPGKKPQK